MEMWLIFATLMATACSSTISNQLKSGDCMGMKQPTNITFDQVMGSWNLKELTYHVLPKDSNKGTNIEVDFCPTVEIHPKKNPTKFSLLWSWDEGSVDYTFQFQDGQTGIWDSVGFQNWVARNLKQFAGVVRVMKVDKSFLVLNFCVPKVQYFSLTLIHDEDVLDLVHDLMKKEGLPLVKRTTYCKNGNVAQAVISTFFWPIIAAVTVAIIIIITLFYFFL